MTRRFAALFAVLALATTPVFAGPEDEPGMNGDIASVAYLFSHDSAPKPTPGAEYLDFQKLDYSLESLKHVNEYLEKVRTSKTLEQDWMKICLRAGAYVGEVIRRSPGKTKFNWIDYETASKLNPEVFADGESEIGLALVLYDGDKGFVFPLAKVQKFLVNGPEDDLYTFASAVIASFNE